MYVMMSKNENESEMGTKSNFKTTWTQRDPHALFGPFKWAEMLQNGPIM